MFIIMQVN